MAKAVWLEYRESDGMVVNAIVFNDERDHYDPPEGFGLVRRGRSRAWIGWTYDGESFSQPEGLDE